MSLRIASLVGSAVGQLGWPTGTVHHAFFDTPKGQLHYVTSGLALENLNPDKEPLLYLHGHPRSSTDFKQVFAELDGAVPVIAVDWFGMGFSEAYAGRDSDDFCTFEEFAGYAIAIVDSLGVDRFVPAGALKGAHPSIEIAAQAGPQRVRKLVLMSPLILSPDQQSFIENMLIPMGKHPQIFANGSHVLDAWADTSGTYPIYPDDLYVNQEKTADLLASAFTNWQYQAGWAAYNEKLPKRLAEIDVEVETLHFHALIAYRIWSTFGLDPTFSLEQFDKVYTHAHNESHFIEASEGLMSQNASYIAHSIKKFVMGSRPATTSTTTSPLGPNTLTLSNGVVMPSLSLGVYQYNDTEAKEAILAAFDNGFYMIDGAEQYHNNRGVGEAVQILLKNRSRESIFLQGKLEGCSYQGVRIGHCYKDTLALAEKQLQDYGVDYVDSMVLHFPPLPVVAAGGCPGQLFCQMIRHQWKAMVEFYKAGKARALGVSNYCKNCYHNCLMEGNFDVMPHVHQVSYHLGMGPDSQGYVAHAKENNMTIQAYSTLGNKPEWYFWEPKGLNPRILSGDAFDGGLGSIAKRHNKSTVQVALKWVVQKGFTALTKSGNPKHLAQDSDIYDFELDEADLKVLDQEVPGWPASHADHGLHGMPAWACHPPISPTVAV